MEVKKDMTEITTAITTVVGLGETMLTAITGNAIMVVILAAGFASLGLRMIRRIFRTSKSL